MRPYRPLGNPNGRLGVSRSKFPNYVINQSLGADLLVNGDFESGLTGWQAFNSATLTNPAGTRTGGSGTKVLRVARNATNTPGAYKNPAGAIAGDVHRLSGWTRGDGTFAPQLAFAGTGGSIQTMLAANSWQQFDLLFVNDATPYTALFESVANSAGFAEFDDVSEAKVTLNPQITVPSPNMRITQYYTLTASPVVGTEIWVMSRISNFASGNYWLTRLIFTTSSQWNINLFSVASGVRTNRTSGANIGATNGIRINMNGNLIDLQTTANGGVSWTTIGSQVNNSLYNTAQGVNCVYTPTNTIGPMIYEAAA